jgi:hypothetical protein
MTCVRLHVVLKCFETLNTSLKHFGAAGHRLHASEPRNTHDLMFGAIMLLRQGTQYMLLAPSNTLSKQSLRGRARSDETCKERQSVYFFSLQSVLHPLKLLGVAGSLFTQVTCRTSLPKPNSFTRVDRRRFCKTCLDRH